MDRMRAPAFAVLVLAALSAAALPQARADTPPEECPVPAFASDTAAVAHVMADEGEAAVVKLSESGDDTHFTVVRRPADEAAGRPATLEVRVNNGGSDCGAAALTVDHTGKVTAPVDVVVGQDRTSVHALAQEVATLRLELERLANTSLEVNAALQVQGASPGLAATSCWELHKAGYASGDYWLKWSDSYPAVWAYCDMTRDGGGWTRIMNFAPTQEATFETLSQWPKMTETDDVDATRLYMGPLDFFAGGELREEIASGKYAAYGRGLTLAQLGQVRDLYGYEKTVTGGPLTADNVPPCASYYRGAMNNVGCSGSFNNNLALRNSYKDTAGWSYDLFVGSNCWAMTGGSRAGERGSSHCPGSPDGTKWARLYIREQLSDADLASNAPLGTADNPGTTCKALLEAGVTTSGNYWLKLDTAADAAVLLTYCDQTRDGGGWTRVVSYPPSATYQQTFEGYPSMADVADVDALRMYKGGFGRFGGGDAREEITSGARKYYGRGLTEAQMGQLRLMYTKSYATSGTLTDNTCPPCYTAYSGGSPLGCCTAKLAQRNQYRDAGGWAYDVDVGGNCWGVWMGSTAYAGSALCEGKPNGSKFSHVYVREP